MMSARTRPGRLRALLILSAVAGLGAGGWFVAARAKQAGGENPPAAGRPRAETVSVEVVRPRAGGLDRVCVQPGTVEPFEAADLYAKASGFLAEQAVDIGSRVHKGDVLARLAVPELEKQVQRDAARVKAAEAKVRQQEAAVASAEAEAKAAAASVALANVLVRAKASYRQYRERQLARIKDLARQSAIEQRVVDEQEDFFLSAQEAENAAREGVNSAAERVAAAKARIAQARADLEQARSEVGVAQADVERSRVLADYAVVRSPYTGVVTRRSFHVGDFVRSADGGGGTPLFTVERTDVMRVVVQVPDRDVPFVSLGDPAVVEIDALPGVAFRTGGLMTVAVARWAESEDPATRTMRTEIDVTNPTGRLRRGMYGRVTLTLQAGAPSAVRIPTVALAGRGPGAKATVRVVRGDRAVVTPVVLGTDNGVEVEVLSGLTPADRVVVRAGGALDDATAVTVAGAEPGSP